VNLLAYLARLGLADRVLLLSTDEEAGPFYQKRGFKAVYTPEPMNTGYLGHEKGRTHWTRMHIWFERTRAVQQLLTLGYTVIHTDADALWFKDPLPELTSLAKAGHDLIFSRGNAATGKNSGHGLGVSFSNALCCCSAAPLPSNRVGDRLADLHSPDTMIGAVHFSNQRFVSGWVMYVSASTGLHGILLCCRNARNGGRV
jgi:hypothetical protein